MHIVNAIDLNRYIVNVRGCVAFKIQNIILI